MRSSRRSARSPSSHAGRGSGGQHEFWVFSSLAERESGAVELDCSSVEMFGPFGVALVAASIAVRRHQGAATRLIPPKKRECAKFFEEVALERLATGEQTGIGSLEVRQMLSLGNYVPVF